MSGLAFRSSRWRRRWSRRKADVLTSRGQASGSQGSPGAGAGRTADQVDSCSSATRILLRRARSRSFRRWWRHGKGAVDAAAAAKESAQTRLTTVLPAQKASAEAGLAEAQVELDKMTTYAGVDGRVDQFVLRVGDIVQPAPVTRAAGILIPEGAGESRLFAGFNQIEAQVLEVGMVAEATCISKPMTIIPLVVTKVQSVIAAGQITGTNLLTEMQKIGAARHCPGVSRAALRRRIRRRPAGKQLHRKSSIPITTKSLNRRTSVRWRRSICTSSIRWLSFTRWSFACRQSSCRSRRWCLGGTRAFSSEADPGSHKENASQQKARASVPIQSERKRLY